MFNPKMKKVLEDDLQLQKLNEIVVQAIEEEKLISQKLYDLEEKNVPFSGRLADKVASFGGSWSFILLFFLLMTGWVVSNLFWLRNAFDPYPFIFLNLILSTLAALQAPVIMMSQNRKEKKDRQRAVNDYMVNLKAEIEVRNLQQKVDLLMSEQMKALFDLQKLQLQMVEDIKKALSTKPPVHKKMHPNDTIKKPGKSKVKTGSTKHPTKIYSI